MKEIRVGDLAYVVKWPCCGLNLGKVGRVAAIDHVRSTYCVQCGAVIDVLPNADFPNTRVGSLACVPLAWLKRIDPPGLTEESKEELSA